VPGKVLPRLIATWFGCGLSPIAPGTVGSLGTIPLHFALKLLPWPAHLAAIVAISGLGVWAAQRYAEATGEEDPQKVVIDEVAGTLIAMGMVSSLSLASQAAAFVLFRVFDITKPSLIDKVQSLKPAGVGIMADDVLAGLAAGALALAFFSFYL